MKIVTNLTAQAVSSTCTPQQHASSSDAKPTALIELGTGPHGKYAVLAFPDGWQRTIGFMEQADAWHPMFADLPVADTHRLQRHTEPPVIKHADGSRTRQGALTFITVNVNRQGGFVSENCFDVPMQNTVVGWATGYRCAKELVSAVKRGYGPHINLGLIIEAAATAASHKTEFNGLGQRSAGAAFMAVVSQAMGFLIRHGKAEAWIDQEIKRTEASNEWYEKAVADEKAAFVLRMKVARAAKRAGSQGVRNDSD